MDWGLHLFVFTANLVLGFEYPKETPSISATISERECQKIISSYPPPRNFRIYGGEVASLGEFPHMVAIFYVKDDGAYEFRCGGSLLSSTFVITVAHCVALKPILSPTPNVVRIGVLNISESRANPETDFSIIETIVHPDYNMRSHQHNLALIRLAVPVQFNTFVHPICLYTSHEDPSVPVTVTGWGLIDDTTRSNFLLKANLKVFDTKVCSETYEFLSNPTDKGTNWSYANIVCAGDSEGLKDACNGDSGGPLQALTSNTDTQYRLVGLVSLGKGCLDVHRSGMRVSVYTRVSSYRYWIEDIVWPPTKP